MTAEQVNKLYRAWQTLVWKPAPRSEHITDFNRRNERIRKAKERYDAALQSMSK